MCWASEISICWYTLRSARARQWLTFHFRTTKPEIDRWLTSPLNEIKICRRNPNCIPSRIMRGVFEDLRYAAGVLRRTPALTAVAVLTLALGIAATTTVFGWIDGMVLHPFGGATDDGQLAVLETVRASGIEAPSVSYADCRDFQDSLRSISGLALNEKAPASIGDGENAYSAWIESVSGN